MTHLSSVRSNDCAKWIYKPSVQFKSTINTVLYIVVHAVGLKLL